MYTPKFSTKRVLGLVMASALAVSGVVAVAGSSEATASTFAISPKTGPETVGTVVTITGTGFTTAAGASTLYATAVQSVEWVTGTCSAAVVTTAVPGSILFSGAVTVQSSKVLVVTAPALPLLPLTKPTAWTACIYGAASSGALLGSAKYKAYPVATIGSANVPASGPAAGGTAVIVTGTGFTAASKVKFGAVASTKVSVAKDGLSLTAIAPAQAASATAVNVVVTTEAGANTTSTTLDNYTYVNGISVTPSSGTTTATHVITVKGVGFNTVFTAANASAGVVLTDIGLVAFATNIKYTCGSVQVISDTQLVCTVPTPVVAGAYIVVVTSDVGSNTGGTTAYESVVSSGAAYIAAPF
jgi:hypothetical protein